MCRGIVAAIKSEVTSIRSTAEAVGLDGGFSLGQTSQDKGLWRDNQPRLHRSLEWGALKDLDTQAIPRPIKLESSTVCLGIRSC